MAAACAAAAAAHGSFRGCAGPGARTRTCLHVAAARHRHRRRREAAGRARAGAGAGAGQAAVVVLAGGLTGDRGRPLPAWVERRLDRAAELHRGLGGAAVLCSGGGTPHKPPLLAESGWVLEEVGGRAVDLQRRRDGAED